MSDEEAVRARASENAGRACGGRGGAWVRFIGPIASALVISGVALFAVLDHPHRAVLMLVAALVAAAVARASVPAGAVTWLSGRHRWLDVVMLLVLAAAIWWLSPFTATVAR